MCDFHKQTLASEKDLYHKILHAWCIPQLDVWHKLQATFFFFFFTVFVIVIGNKLVGQLKKIVVVV